MGNWRWWGAVVAGWVGLTGCGPEARDAGWDGADVTQEDEAEAPPIAGAEAEVLQVEEGLTSAWTATLRYAPEADATVDATQPDARLGTGTRLTVDGSPERRAYLRFRLEGLRGQVTKATLRLFAKDPTRAGVRVYAAGSDWREDTLRWSNAPAPSGSPLSQVSSLADEAWVELDVTAAVRGDGAYTFALASDASDGAVFVSRDSTLYMNKPQLVVQLDIDEPCQVGGAPPVVAGESCSYRGGGTGGTTAGWFGVGGTGSESLSMVGGVGSDLVVAGNYWTWDGNSASYGGPALPESGFAVARLKADGTHVWSRGFSYRPSGWQTPLYAQLVDASLSPSGGTTLVGSYEGTPDFGTGRLPPGAEDRRAMFLLQVGADGLPRWSKGILAAQAPGDTQPQEVKPYAVATDGTGAFTVVGTFRGAVNLGGSWLVSGGTVSHDNANPPRALFLARFTADGQHLWSRALTRAPGFESQYLNGDPPVLAVDAAGNVVLGGQMPPGMDLGGGAATGLTRPVPFVARYAANGTFLWQRQLTGAVGQVKAVAASGSRVFFSGNVFGRFTFAGREYTKDISYTPIVGALTPTGSDVWLRALGTTSQYELEHAMTVDAAGNVVLTGRIALPWTAGGGVLRAGRLVASYGPDGAHRWSRTLSVNLMFSQLGLLPTGEVLLGNAMSRAGTLEDTTYHPRNLDLVLMRLKP